MGYWRRRRWRFNSREVLRRSEALFAPGLDLWWNWRGTSIELVHGKSPDGNVIWDSSEGAMSWEYPSCDQVADEILTYMNIPVANLREHKIDHVCNVDRWYSNAHADNWKLLPRFLLAADRRLGKNRLSVWLFTEPDIRVRNIIGARV
jgi:hypothetical protein